MRGFIGPLGDDLPSLIAIMLALTLFFSGLAFAMNVFNQRQRRVRVVKGALDISRALTREPVLEAQGQSDLVDDKEALTIAKNNNLDFNAAYGNDDIVGDSARGSSGCGNYSIYFSYLVSRESSTGIQTDTLRVCVWEVEQ